MGASALAAFGYFALAGTDAETSYRMIVGPLLAAGVGVALTVPSMTAAVLTNVEKQRTGIASGALNAARQTGGVIGVGVFGSLVAEPDRLLSGMHLAMILAGAALVIGCIVSILGIGPHQSTKGSCVTRRCTAAQARRIVKQSGQLSKVRPTRSNRLAVDHPRRHAIAFDKVMPKCGGEVDRDQRQQHVGCIDMAIFVEAGGGLVG